VTSFDTVGLVVHPRRRLDAALETVQAWAAANGASVVQIRTAGQDRVVAEPGDVESCDLVIALGGDGTALAALHAAGPVGRPVLGVACGSLGALTSTTAEDLDHALDLVSRGEWRSKRLPGLSISAQDGQEVVALNDLVVIRRGAGQVTVAVEVDGELFVRCAGDGVVIATPQGSSAYTLAAGGPVLAPGSDAFVITPLAPHGGCCPPLVAGSESRLRIEIEPGHGGARIELDGRITELEPQVLEVQWQPTHATLVTLGDEEPFLAGLRRRRIIMDSPRILARDDRLAAGRLLPQES
jgi:NAD+ kinase